MATETAGLKCPPVIGPPIWIATYKANTIASAPTPASYTVTPIITKHNMNVPKNS